MYSIPHLHDAYNTTNLHRPKPRLKVGLPSKKGYKHGAVPHRAGRRTDADADGAGAVVTRG
ncbi:hypothetical protein L0Y40_02585 [Candidatus Wolfebacteria bacterium]|nr:hypothetical protein [Candidatus Wolfebacteria bacterium]